MGGATITKTGKTKEIVRDEVLEQIELAVPNLWADSSLILLNPSTGETELYKVNYKGRHGEKIELEPTEKGGAGAGIAIAVSSRFSKKPLEGEWVGMVHLHT